MGMSELSMQSVKEQYNLYGVSDLLIKQIQ